MGTAILTLGREPSEAELLGMGDRFCDKWREAVDGGVGATGPLFVSQALEQELSGDDQVLLRLVVQPAQEFLCPELLVD